MLPVRRKYFLSLASTYRLLSSPNIMAPTRAYAVTLDNMNPHVIALQYAVRGPIVARALEIEKELANGVKKPFNEVIKCNIGDCHAMGQTPNTFLRQVIALCSYPELLNDANFPEDAKNRAKRILDGCAGHSVGSYSNSCGIDVIRKDIAAYISERDGIPSNSDDIFLSTGASDAIKSILALFNTGKDGNGRAGVMVPIPQYPLYSATNAEYNAYQINYYLNEAENWGMKMEELERALSEAKGKCDPRAIVVINPGNPTGQVLTKQDIENVIRFAAKHHLFILADEVYQHNIYGNTPFNSFKKVLHGMGSGYSDTVELASFMSSSKGFMGECGFRGGYCELTNMNPDVKAQLYKMLSAKLCSSVLGQAMMDVVVNHPKQGEPSYDTFMAEKNKVLGDLKFKANLASETFNSLPGFKCNTVAGAMYAFPRFELPPKAIQEAEKRKQAPDAFYCFTLLEEAGICVVPGSGFGQLPGTLHFRMTILPTVEKLKLVMEKFKIFHASFLKRYS